MKQVINSISLITILLTMSACSTFPLLCHKATGIEYDPHSGYIYSILNDSPASKTDIKPGEWLMVHDGGHIVVQGTDGKLRTYELKEVCVNIISGHISEWKQ